MSVGLRALRRISVLSVHPQGRCGASCTVGARCKIRSFGKLKRSGKANGWELPFGGQHDNEYVLRGMLWVDNYRLFCDSREKLICMVNDIIEELLDLDMEFTGLPFSS